MGLTNKIQYRIGDLFNNRFKLGRTYGITENNLFKLNRHISIRKRENVCIIDLNNILFNTTSVKSEINYYCDLTIKKEKFNKKNIEEQLNLLGLDNSFLEKKVYEFSKSEKSMFYIFLKTQSSCECFIINNVFCSLDRNNQKLIKKYIEKLKENKAIIVIDKDINNLYDLCDDFIYVEDDKKIDMISKKEFPDNLKYLIEKKQLIPDVLYLTYLAKTNKKVKLTYYSDVRDVIKDIYKHV